MSEKPYYPQIPSTVWWGMRTSLRRSPNATVDENFLAINLNVQPAAARQYLVELRRVGLLTDDGKATPLAMKWRNDETYREAADQVVRANYPQSLLDVAPPGEAERPKVLSWFMHNGLGEGTAKNKTGTYLLIANDQIQDAPEARAAAPSRTGVVDKRATKKQTPPQREPQDRGVTGRREHAFPLNVNVQIHISADASTEQIQAIFAAMKQYLRDDQAA